MLSLPTEPAFARTYDASSYADPYDAIIDYQSYDREYRDGELGSSAVSTRMAVPRGRIQSWERGSKPDAVNGLSVAREYGWIECPVDGETFGALNRLVASVFAGGSVDGGFGPAFSASTESVEQQLRTDLSTVGAGCQQVESNSQQHTDLRPTEHKAVFGRVLVALGAPKGRKTESVDRLPAYLEWVEPQIRREFVRVYILNRATELDDKNHIQISERRPADYLESLADLVHSVSGVDVWSGDRSIRIHEDVLPMLEIELS